MHIPDLKADAHGAILGLASSLYGPEELPICPQAGDKAMIHA